MLDDDKPIAANIIDGAKILHKRIGHKPMDEADKVRRQLHDDPFVSNEDYGRLVEEAEEADERKSWELEKGDE